MTPAQRAKPTTGADPGDASRNRVLELPVPESDVGLVTALRAGRREARVALFNRYSKDVERVLYRILGPDAELKDLLQDVFVVALGSIHGLRDPDALRGWLAGIAVRKARKCILRRRRWRFIQLSAPADLPERTALVPSPEISEALRCTYAVLERMPADERVTFALRYIDGMELQAVAGACGVSLSTAKRRVARAHRTFTVLARQHAVLTEWLERGEASS
jgi:RNA polymerase sigma-70 factor (ECF subfamily)